MSIISLISLCFVGIANALLCFNCSSSYENWDHCGGYFMQPSVAFNNSRLYLTNCTEENSMCFVRSWTARDKHAWIVQRGCYQLAKEDPFPRAMNTPARAMSCKIERLSNAEYKTCLCNADWCNSAIVLKNPCKHSQIFKNPVCVMLIYAYFSTL